MIAVSVSNSGFVIAASQGSTPAWVTPVIAGGAAIAAAIVTALSGAYVARRKVSELQLSNSFELAKQYLESARSYTQSVYLPLAVEVYNLQDAFLTYKASGQSSGRSERDDPQSPGDPQPPREQFENACWLFIGAVSTLFRNGAGAVLTIRLDEDVTGVISFLRESISAERSIKTRSWPEIFTRSFLTGFALVLPLTGLSSVIPTKQLIEFGIGSGVEYEFSAAPIFSADFEKQFSFYMRAISSGIKQVTLGGYRE
jgi:hypothetical protein